MTRLLFQKCNHMTDQELISEIIDWAVNKPEFDTDFVWDMQAKLDEFHDLTPQQRKSLENIYRKWGVNES